MTLVHVQSVKLICRSSRELQRPSVHQPRTHLLGLLLWMCCTEGKHCLHTCICSSRRHDMRMSSRTLQEPIFSASSVRHGLRWYMNPHTTEPTVVRCLNTLAISFQIVSYESPVCGHIWVNDCPTGCRSQSLTWPLWQCSLSWTRLLCRCVTE